MGILLGLLILHTFYAQSL